MRARARAVVVLTAVLAWAPSARAAHDTPLPHPSDETEVFTGSEDVAAGQAVHPPAVRYWRVHATISVGKSESTPHLAMLVPLSDGRQDVLARRAGARGFQFREREEPPNLKVEWSAGSPAGGELTYDTTVRVAESATPLPAVPVAGL
ncbi:MAG TPA: hypothetical protein VLV15_11775, partial [Dongiaceae bacterium]|nr:hypothetical protein [Dongiaceae bacterium]